MLTVWQTHDLTRARPLLERALRFDVYGTGGQLIDLIAGCLLFELKNEAGEVVGAFAARCDTYSDGRVMTVTAAGGLPGYDLTAAIDAWMREAARDAKARRLQCITRRRGLIKKLKATGYHVAGVILAKDH